MFIYINKQLCHCDEFKVEVKKKYPKEAHVVLYIMLKKERLEENMSQPLCIFFFFFFFFQFFFYQNFTCDQIYILILPKAKLY